MTTSDRERIGLVHRILEICGTDLGVRVFIAPAAAGVHGPFERPDVLETHHKISLAWRAAGIEAAIQAAVGEYELKTRRRAQVLAGVMAALDGPPLVHVLDAEIEALGTLRRALSQPLKRVPAGSAA